MVLFSGLLLLPLLLFGMLKISERKRMENMWSGCLHGEHGWVLNYLSIGDLRGYCTYIFQ